MSEIETYVTEWTLHRVLERQALSRPDKVFVTLENESITYAEAHARAAQVANLLHRGGVEAGEYVAVMLPNCIAFCDAWLGLSRLGAVHVAVNTDYMGRFLVHLLNNCQARMLIVDADYVDRINSVREDLEFLETLYVVGKHQHNTDFPVRHFDDRFDYPSKWDGIGSAYSDTGCVMYTSGTTGPSKGVLMPNAHLYLFGLGTIEHMNLVEDDVFYIVLPLFHANGLFMQLYATLIAGASAVIRKRFSASSWIQDIVDHRITITNSLGVIAAFVLNQPASKLDQIHQLRAMGLAPTSEDLVKRLRERFNIPLIYGMYGMTEVNIPLYTPANSEKENSCGRVWSRYYDLRIVNPDTDEEMDRGQAGEIVVRPRQPFGFMSGYLNMPEKTVEAFRNFWFHTGDAAWMDDEGDVFFVDRIKDCIRRRGENISSYEVEGAISSYPGVQDVAAFAVDSDIDGAEDEVMVAIVADHAVTSDMTQLHRHVTAHLPGFAVPRYYRFVEELPKTPTGKVQKHLLREDGVTDATIDLK